MQLLSDEFLDSKEFVDRPLKVSPDSVLSALPNRGETGKIPPAKLKEILRANFGRVGEDLEKWTPDDWRDASEASLLTRIKDNALREWAFNLHNAWKELGRKVGYVLIVN